MAECISATKWFFHSRKGMFRMKSLYMCICTCTCMYEKERKKVSCCASILNGVSKCIDYAYHISSLQIANPEIRDLGGIKLEKEQMGLLM